MSESGRFQCIVSETIQVITLRPIGDVAPAELVERVFEKLSTVPRPWTYARLLDVRRWSHRLGPDTIQALAARWAALTEGKIYHARIAVVTFDHGTVFRTPIVSAHFPDETACYFDDYHEAVGWLGATEPAAFLKALAHKSPNRHTYGGLVIE